MDMCLGQGADLLIAYGPDEATCILSGTIRVSWHQKSKTRKVKSI